MELVSVIIPAYNEENYIEKTLESIKSQDYPNIEVIVVCNGCTDKTEEIARKYTNQVIISSEKNVSIARNLGSKEAKGEFLVFLDADTTLFKEVVSKISEQLNKGSFYGTLKATTNNKLKYRIHVKTKNLINKFIPWSNGIIYCKKEDFAKTGGFNAHLKQGEIKPFFKDIKNHANYKRLNSSRVFPSTRRIDSWGITKLGYYWIKKSKKEYEVIR